MRRLCLILVAAIFGVGLGFANGFAADTGDGAADTLSAYLHGRRLPLVEARMVTNESGQRSLMLYGFVATDYGKRDAEDQARDFMDDPDVEIINHIKVRPELLTLERAPTTLQPWTRHQPWMRRPIPPPPVTDRRRNRPLRPQPARISRTRSGISRTTRIRSATMSSC